MAVTHVTFNDQLPHGRLLRRALAQLEEGLRDLTHALDAMPHMIDNDAQGDARFDYLMAKFGFRNLSDAKAAWQQMTELRGKLTTDDSVAGVATALTQAFAKFR